MSRIAVALLLVATACGGSRQKASDGSGDPPERTAVSDASVTPAEPVRPSSDPLTAAECDDFVDHVVALAARMRAQEATDPAEVNTEDEIAGTQAKLRAELRDECLRVDRALFDCAMKAQDGAALQACQN